MRSHGVTNFPDPIAGKSGNAASFAVGSVDINSPTYRSAQQACHKYLTSPGANLTPAQYAQREAQLLKYAQCMRSHGLPNFPDPTTGPSGAPTIALTPSSGINPDSPTYQAAESACQSLKGGNGD